MTRLDEYGSGALTDENVVPYHALSKWQKDTIAEFLKGNTVKGNKSKILLLL